MNILKQIYNKPIGVYVKINSEGYVTDINSEIFLDKPEGWVKIDEGYGDKYAHAQNQYFTISLLNEKNEYQIKL